MNNRKGGKVKINWLIEKDIFFDTEELMCKEIRKQNHNFYLFKYIPVVCEIEKLPFSDQDCIIFYGSLNAATVLDRKFNFIPGVFGAFSNYKCSTYYNYFLQYLLNKDFQFIAYKNLIQEKDKIFSKFGVDNTIFIRPDSGLKPFTGRTIYTDEFEDIIQNEFTLYGDIVDESLCVISSPKKIQSECRFIIADGKIITGCQYRANGKHIESKEYDIEQKIFLKNILKNSSFRPDIIWVADTCKTAYEKIHLLEIGSFSCSGLYKCNLESIVRIVSELSNLIFLEKKK